MKKLRITLLIAMILGFIAFPIIFWKSLIIWVTPVFPIAFSAYLCTRNDRRWEYTQKIRSNPFLYLSLGIAVGSTVLQFWSQIDSSVNRFINGPGPIYTGAVMVVVLIAIAIFSFIQRSKKRKQLKRANELATKHKEELRLQQEERDKQHKEKFQKKQEVAKKLLASMSISEAKITWANLKALYDADLDIPPQMIPLAKFEDTLQISLILKKIVFLPSVVEFAVWKMSSFVNECDDIQIEKIQRQMEALKKVRTFDGYQVLYDKMMHIASQMRLYKFFSTCIPSPVKENELV